MDLYTITTQEILDRISRHCPEALSTYLICINHIDNDSTAYFSKDYVENKLSQRWVKFKNRIKMLALENLLHWHVFDKGIVVTLADIEENG